ncbi:hypothetical protein BGW38_007577 [Lunasporangiospora selenospora]|uniref:Uncharacterized protein n=1 Tax=Lunasporangiospora selenospora TaxID=979761 RepID=A0A9P6FKI0_9FUNG|nr:hypothetical protein BGW38_007577 [Lunasporangiospora selenospora]
MFCLDSQAFEVVTKTQEQQLEARQLHRQRIRQHVQERLAEQNNVVEQDGVISHASPILPDGIGNDQLFRRIQAHAMTRIVKYRTS